MGNWNINIQGVGAHHNADYPRDANRMAREFTAALRAAGHNVQSATFTYGGLEDLGADAEGQPRPLEPAAPVTSATPSRASYSREVKGDPLNGGHFTYSFSAPGEKAEFDFEIPAMDTRRFTLSGDGGWAEGYVTVELDGQQVDRQQPYIGPGRHKIIVTCGNSDHARDHGVAYSTIDLDRRA